MTRFDPPWYDSREALEAKLEEGLPGLHEIQKARREAGYGRKERLSEWCLLGRFRLDTCGNFMQITEGAPADGHRFRDYEAEPKLTDVMDWATTGKVQPGMMSSTLGGALPPEGVVCDRCASGWSVRSLSSYYSPRKGDGYLHRHKGCHRLAIIDDEREYMIGLLDEAEIPYSGMTMIPSGYHSDDLFFGPWFVVQLSEAKGEITIGWRKRVINIDWSKASLPDGDTLFADEDVTKGPTMIHAWGKDHAIRYLRSLWLGSLTDPGVIPFIRAEVDKKFKKPPKGSN
jgi:hypothetical protein